MRLVGVVCLVCPGPLGVDIGAVSDEGKIPGVTADEDPISKDLADPAGVILDTSSFNSLSFFIGVCCL